MALSMFGGDAAHKLAALDKSQAIIEFNLDGTVITANANFCGALGYELAEIKGKHHSMFCEPAYAASAEYREFWAKLNRGEFQAAQYKRIGKGGKEIWIEASYNPLLGRGGKPYRVVKFATDISKQKAEYADLVGKIEAIGRSQAVIEFTLDGTIITANENFLQTLGYTLPEIKGKHHSMFAEPAYAASPEYKAFWAKLGRGEYDAGQYKRIGKGGKEVWIEASYNPIMDQNGRPCKVVKFATDLTKRKAQNLALANDFENGVKSLVQEVSSSAKGMEGTAQNLAAAAEQTNQQSSHRLIGDGGTGCLGQRDLATDLGIDPGGRDRGQRGAEVGADGERSGHGRAEGRRGDADHQRHRQPDQPTGPQRHDRGCARGARRGRASRWSPPR